MCNTTKLDNIFSVLTDVEYDLECFLEVITELENFYEMEEKTELARRCHSAKNEVKNICGLLNKGVVALDDYILEMRRDSK